MPTYSKRFRSQDHYEIEIENVEDRSIVGTLRIKPVGLSWMPPNGKAYRSVSIEAFAKWIEEVGKRVSQ